MFTSSRLGFWFAQAAFCQFDQVLDSCVFLEMINANEAVVIQNVTRQSQTSSRLN